MKLDITVRRIRTARARDIKELGPVFYCIFYVKLNVICEILHRSVASRLIFALGPRSVLSGVYAESLKLRVPVHPAARDRETDHTYGELVGVQARAEARLVGTRFETDN